MDDVYLEQKCIMVASYDEAARIQQTLIENGYVVMISREEQFWCVNWCWTGIPANRSKVIFRDRESFEVEWDQWIQRHPEIDWDIDEEEDNGEEEEMV